MLAFARLFIRFYQRFLSPLLHSLGGAGSGCRFDPTCSDYFLQALETHGLFRGTRLGLLRVTRCHPWGGSGSDPVPGPDQLLTPAGTQGN